LVERTGLMAMSSGMTEGNGVAVRPNFSEYWKDDFVALQHAGKSILSALRKDESSAHGDLYRRILSPPSSSSTSSETESIPNHHYFAEGAWKHVQSIPLPPYLQEQVSKAKMSTMMGLFPEAELAWITIDDHVYLWTYTRSVDSHFLSFQVPSHQPIVSIGLAPPKQGKYLLDDDDDAW
jgi:nuclear pore complex protein Nup155